MIKSVEAVIKVLGGPTKTAAIVGVTAPGVIHWRTRGIPPQHFVRICAAVEAIGEGPIDPSVFAFKARDLLEGVSA